MVNIQHLIDDAKMQKAAPLIRTKLRLPFTRPGQVSRPRLQEQIVQGLRGPLTLVTAPAGFGKTTLVASCIAGCGLPAAWLSLDKDDNQAGRFLHYLVAALQGADNTIGSEATQLLAALQPVPPEAVLTSLVNDLDATGREIALVLDDYQFISSQAVHEAMAFLLEHCPTTLHMVIVTRSDPPLPLARLRARGQTVELRAADLRFTEPEAAQFLNDVMGLRLDAASVAALEERTEGWAAGLQMAALSVRDRKDVVGFIEGFSGTNRYILDYLLEEVLASQPLEMQCFLLCTSILDRLTAPLCEAVLEVQKLEDWIIDKLSTTFQPSNLLNCQPILEYLERANLFLMPLDDERQWYRYHHLFADLLRARLEQLYPGLAPQLHARAAAWYEQNDSILEAIQHASMAPDDEMVEGLIEQHYMEMVNRGEMSEVRFWMGRLSQDMIYRRPWLCLYEALSRSWFGQLDEADLLLDKAEKRIRSEGSASGAQPMLGYHAFVKSRVTAMRGDTRRAIEYCRTARATIPADNLGLQNDVSITLGYEYFLVGDFANADQTLYQTIRSGYTSRAINNPVAAYALLARVQGYQGRLHDAYDLLQKAAQLIQEADGQYLGATGLVEVGIAALLCEWNDVQAALDRVKQGLEHLPWWGKADDSCLAYTTLARIHLALGNRANAERAIEKAAQLIQAGSIFSEARSAMDAAQVRLWLVQGDRSSVDRWVAALGERFGPHDPFQYEDELAHITQARVFIAQNKVDEAIRLLSRLEESARSGGRAGRLVEIILLKALALQAVGDTAQADSALAESLTLAEPSGYVRVFLDEGRPMQLLLAQWPAHAGAGPLRDYGVRLLTHFDAEPLGTKASPAGVPSASSGQPLVEALSRREVEVLQLIAMGQTNQDIARQLIVAPGTVKAHTASIYRKLDVANRTEAVARARQLGILP
jgi:LuxR family maltose regulon positive regulatory protein